MSGTQPIASPAPAPAAASVSAPAPAPSGEQPGATSAVQPNGTQGNGQSPAPSSTPAWVQPRIDELTRARRESERQLEAERANTARLEGLLRAAGGQPSPSPGPAPTPASTEADFERRVQETANARAFNEQCNRVYQDTVAGDAAFAQNWDRMKQAIGVPSNDLLQQFVGEADAGKILNHFAQNFDDASRIFALPLVQQVRELERLRAKIASVPAAPAVSGAPAPISTTDGAHATAGNPADYEHMSVDEFMAARNAKSRRRS
jgi:hypothetical protein